MVVAIDESGDNGRKFWRGSSKWFVVAAVIVKGDLTCGDVCQSIEQFIHRHHLHEELHFAHNSTQLHHAFLAAMANEPFEFVCIAINKTKLATSRPWLLSSRLALYTHAIGRLFVLSRSQLHEPTVLIDRNGSHWFTKAVNRSLLKQFGSRHKGDLHAIKQIYVQDSEYQPLIQLADYVAGSARHYVERYSDAQLYERYLHRKGVLIVE